MTRKIDHRDIVLICIIVVTLGVQLMDQSGAWRLVGAIIVAVAALAAFVSYLRQLPWVDKTESNSSTVVESNSTVLPAVLTRAVAEHRPAGVGRGHFTQVVLLQEWQPGERERHWRYVKRAPESGEFYEVLVGWEVSEWARRGVPVSKQVQLKKAASEDDPALEDLWRAWGLMATVLAVPMLRRPRA